jgi:LPXTG-motif cell wall-anchored protein
MEVFNDNFLQIGIFSAMVALSLFLLRKRKLKFQTFDFCNPDVQGVNRLQG